MGLPPSPHHPEEVRALAEEILADPRYRREPESIPDRVLGWIGERVAELLGQLVGGGGGTVIAWSILLAAVGATVYLLVRHGRLGSLAIASPDEPVAMVELSRSPAEWRSQAAAHEREGRWAEGLRCRHRALVADLVGRGALGDQAGRTAGEYVRDVARSLPDAAPAMAAATELFEAAWYGGATTGPDESRRFQDLDQQVLSVKVS